MFIHSMMEDFWVKMTFLLTNIFREEMSQFLPHL